jgi:hypothetical protein
MPRNREPSPNGYTPLEEILRDKERESRIGSSANEHTPLHEILSHAPPRGSRTAPLSTPDPRDSDPLHTPLIVAPRNNWSDNVRSQYTSQVNKLYDAHLHDDGPTAAQIQVTRDWGSDLADREATEARFSAHGWSPGPWRDYSIHNYSYGGKDYSDLAHYPGPVISDDRSYRLPYAERFSNYMDRYERGPIEAYATYRDPNSDHPFARAADGTILGLGTGAISGGGRSGNVASPSYQPSIGLNQRYPLNDGFMTSSPTELPRGYRFLRTGGEGGKFIRPIGTSVDAVSMPPWQEGPTNSYEVVQPFTVDMGRAAPYYGKRGFGTQGKTKESIEDLRVNRYIKKYP